MSIPLTFLAHEEEYRLVVSNFVSLQIDPNAFIEQYFTLWKRDRDAQWEYIDMNRANPRDPQEDILSDTLDRIFTACDCYRDIPENGWEISEIQLRKEIAELARKRWPNDAVS